MNEQNIPESTIDKNLVESIKAIIVTARKNISQKINNELILTYWRIGKEIVDTESKNIPMSRQCLDT